MIWLCMSGYSFLCFVYSNLKHTCNSRLLKHGPRRLISSLSLSCPATWLLPCTANVLTKAYIKTRILLLVSGSSASSPVQAQACVVWQVGPFFRRLAIRHFPLLWTRGGSIWTVMFFPSRYHSWLKKHRQIKNCSTSPCAEAEISKLHMR